jgi:hypothetical protein
MLVFKDAGDNFLKILNYLISYRKKRWPRMSSSPFSKQPRRFEGFFVNSYSIIKIQLAPIASYNINQKIIEIYSRMLPIFYVSPRNVRMVFYNLYESIISFVWFLAAWWGFSQPLDPLTEKPRGQIFTRQIWLPEGDCWIQQNSNHIFGETA